jgi:hypothetical protein
MSTRRSAGESFVKAVAQEFAYFMEHGLEISSERAHGDQFIGAEVTYQGRRSSVEIYYSPFEETVDLRVRPKVDPGQWFSVGEIEAVRGIRRRLPSIRSEAEIESGVAELARRFLPFAAEAVNVDERLIEAIEDRRVLATARVAEPGSPEATRGAALRAWRRGDRPTAGQLYRSLEPNLTANERRRMESSTD